MAEKLDPFRRALGDVRRRLRDGEYPPGARVTAKDIAERLRLSPTPVREALSRLAGEGVLDEHRGDGFFVATLSAIDIAVLYRMSGQILLLGQIHSGERQLRTVPAPPVDGDDPIGLVDRLFMTWSSEGGSRVAAEAFRTASIRLAPVRQLERHLIDDLEQEAERLTRHAAPSAHHLRPEAIRAFYRRRVPLAARLARLLQPTIDIQ